MRSSREREVQLSVASLLFSYVVAGLFFGAFAATAPVLLELSALDKAAFGSLLVLMTVGAIPAMTLLGGRIDRFPQKALPRCLVSFSLACLLLGNAGGVWSLAVSFIAVGAASGALDVALNHRISSIEDDTGCALFNRAHATFPLAVLSAGPLVGLARDHGVGAGWIYAVLAVLMAFSAIIEHRASGPGGNPVDRTSARERSVRISSILVCFGAVAAAGAFLEMSSQSWGVIFIESAFDTSAILSGLAVTAFMLGLSGGRFVAHFYEGRIAGNSLVLAGAAGAIPAFVLIAVADTASLAFVGLFLAGVAVGPIEPTVFRLVAAHATVESRGLALSRVTAIAYVGYLTSPFVLGVIAERAGWAAMWMASAAVAGAVILLTIVMRYLMRTTG